MNVHQVVGIAVRLYALWLALISIQALGLGAAVKNQFSLSPMLALATLVPFLIIVLTAILLWFFPVFVAKKLIPRVSLAEPVSQWAPGDVQRIGICLIGLWAIATYLPSLAKYALLLMASDPGLQVLDVPGTKEDLAATAAGLIIGLGFVIKNRQLSRAISSLGQAPSN